ncbi:MAG: hypothetical protein WD739_07270 [Actinomycetota bacterium]
MATITAREAADALIAALGVKFGDVTLSVANGAVTLIRSGHVVKPNELETFTTEVDRA